MNRFVIITAGRTGSSYLQSMLDSHGDISCKGELLKTTEDRDISADAIDLYLDNTAFNKGKKVQGFKMLYYQFNHYKNFNLDAKYIHLLRRNLLRQYVSYLNAGKKKKWNSTKEEDKTNKPVEVNIDKFEKYKKSYYENRKKVERFLTGKEVLTVYYEELCFEEIQRFLGVGVEPLKTNLIKLNSMSLEDSIVNIKEIIKKYPEYGNIKDKTI